MAKKKPQSERATNMFHRVTKKHVPGIDVLEHVPYNGTHKDVLEQEPMTAATLSKPETVQDFKQYTKRGKSTGELKNRIATFLYALTTCKDVEQVKQVCEGEKAWFLEKYTASATRNTYMTAYRHAIQDCFNDIGIPDNLKTERETAKGLVVQHVAMNYMLAPQEDYAAVRTQTKTKTAQQRDNLTAFDMDAAISATEEALQSDDWRELAAGLIMAVQARPSDMLAAGEFKAVSKYQVQFTSKAKKRGAKVTGNVWTLVDSATFIDAFNRLRRYPDLLELKGKALTEVDSGRNSTLNRAINRMFKGVIPAPHGEKDLSAKNLRAAGVNVNYHLYGRDNQSIGRFAELQLLHDNPGTAANYEDYYCTRNNKRVAEVGLRNDAPLEQKPASEIKSSLTVDRQIVELLEEVAGKGTRREQLERVIAAARRTAQLERDLAAAEARLELLKSQNEPVSKEDLVPMTQTKTKTEDDIKTTPNAELIGSKKRGAAEEKLRRTVEAIKEYNAGRAFDEQVAINKGSLRKITKVKAQTVNEWADEHAEEIEAYTDAQGHGYRQNVGKDLSVIKWDEAAYGSYEWPEGYF